MQTFDNTLYEFKHHKNPGIVKYLITVSLNSSGMCNTINNGESPRLATNTMAGLRPWRRLEVTICLIHIVLSKD